MRRRVVFPCGCWFLCALICLTENAAVRAALPGSEPEKSDILDRIEAYHDRTEAIISEKADWLDEQLNDTMDSVAPPRQPTTATVSDDMDDFFGSPSVFTRMNTTRVQVSPSIQWKQGECFEPNVSFGANLELPLAEERFHIFFDNIDGDMMGPSGRSTPSDKKNSENTFGILFKLYNSDWLETHLTFGTRKVVYPYSRYTITARWENGPWMFEPSQEFMIRSDDGMEETTGFVANRKLNEGRLLRSQSSGVWGKNSNGYEINQSVSYYSMKDIGLDEAGFSASFSVDAHISGSSTMDNYTLNTTLRKKIHWDWCFLEIQPQVEFPRERDYEATFSIEICMDIIFQERGPVIGKQ